MSFVLTVPFSRRSATLLAWRLCQRCNMRSAQICQQIKLSNSLSVTKSCSKEKDDTEVTLERKVMSHELSAC